MLLHLLLACGPSLADREADARAALDARDWAKAHSTADEALEAAGGDAAAAWRLEQIRLDALAGEKNGAEVRASLERLGGTYPKQVNGALYRAVADKLKAAGDGAGAIDVLDAGLKRFPDDAKLFQEQIDAAKATADPDEIERLKALGYL